MPPTINTITTTSTSICVANCVASFARSKQTQKPQRFGLLRRELRRQFCPQEKHKNRDVWNCCGQFVIAN